MPTILRIHLRNDRIIFREWNHNIVPRAGESLDKSLLLACIDQDKHEASLEQDIDNECSECRTWVDFVTIGEEAEVLVVTLYLSEVKD